MITPSVKIQVSGLGKVFPRPDGSAHHVLSDIHLDIREGAFVCLLGPSGCGKTTLLSAMRFFSPRTRDGWPWPRPWRASADALAYPFSSRIFPKSSIGRSSLHLPWPMPLGSRPTPAPGATDAWQCRHSWSCRRPEVFSYDTPLNDWLGSIGQTMPCHTDRIKTGCPNACPGPPIRPCCRYTFTSFTWVW